MKRHSYQELTFRKVAYGVTGIYHGTNVICILTRLEAAEMRFLRSVKGYTRLDKIRSEVIRKELLVEEIRKKVASLERPMLRNTH